MAALAVLLFLIIWATAGVVNLITGRTAQRRAAQYQRQAQYNAWFASLTVDQQILERQRLLQERQAQALQDLRFLTAVNGLNQSLDRQDGRSGLNH